MPLRVRMFCLPTRQHLHQGQLLPLEQCLRCLYARETKTKVPFSHYPVSHYHELLALPGTPSPITITAPKGKKQKSEGTLNKERKKRDAFKADMFVQAAIRHGYAANVDDSAAFEKRLVLENLKSTLNKECNQMHQLLNEKAEYQNEVAENQKEEREKLEREKLDARSWREKQNTWLEGAVAEKNARQEERVAEENDKLEARQEEIKERLAEENEKINERVAEENEKLEARQEELKVQEMALTTRRADLEKEYEDEKSRCRKQVRATLLEMDELKKEVALDDEANSKRYHEWHMKVLTDQSAYELQFFDLAARWRKRKQDVKKRKKLEPPTEVFEYARNPHHQGYSEEWHEKRRSEAEKDTRGYRKRQYGAY